MDSGCDICGNKNLSSIWTGFGVGRYCSYRCASIGQRKINIIFSIIFSLPWIFLFLTPPENRGFFIEDFITLLVFSLLLEIYFIYSAYFGWKEYRKTKNRSHNIF